MGESEFEGIFFVDNYSTWNHIYYVRFRADIYIPVGCDHREPDDYGFMKEVRLDKANLKETTKERVKLWTDMGPIAFEALVSGILLHNP